MIDSGRRTGLGFDATREVRGWRELLLRLRRDGTTTRLSDLSVRMNRTISLRRWLMVSLRLRKRRVVGR
jgi:hypothetical protein